MGAEQDDLMADRQPVRLDHFLKLCGAAGSGGQAKLLIQAGDVLVNGAVETRRRRKLTAGDVVHVAGSDYCWDAFLRDDS